MAEQTWQSLARLKRDRMERWMAHAASSVPVPSGGRAELMARLAAIPDAQIFSCGGDGREPDVEDLRHTVHEVLVLAEAGRLEKQRQFAVRGWEISQHCLCPAGRCRSVCIACGDRWFRRPGGAWKRLGLLPQDAIEWLEAFAGEADDADVENVLTANFTF